MKISAWLLTVIIALLVSGCSSDTTTSQLELHVVNNGEPVMAIILPDNPAPFIEKAASELKIHILKATGVELKIYHVADEGNIPNITRILIGQSKLTEKLGVTVDGLAPEEYRIFSDDRHLVFIGHDTEESPATMWAVCHFLDRKLGVRWLWPGELGTYVPKRDRISFRSGLDITGRPELERRILRYWVQDEEVDDWSLRHQMGSRSDIKFGHAFGDWWDKYHEQHPDYFAVTPEGYKQPYPEPFLVKLNIGNPAVADQVFQEWIDAGKPDNWCVGPNDSAGWCTSEQSRALDPPELRGVPAIDIFRNRVSLTSRFVKFWNGILVRMHELNPKVTLSTYAYSCYREAPTDIKLEPGFIMGVVNTYYAYDSWMAWHDAGAKLLLRPNWWHIGGCAPHLPLHDAGKFFRFTRENSMIGFYFDSIMGYWGTQSPFYYLIARLSEHPEMTVDNVITEYASVFMSAAPAVENYIAYWEDFTARAAYTIPAGGSISQDRDGLYETAAREHNLPLHPLNGGWFTMPYLYTDDVLDGAFALLDDADRLASNDPREVKDRIQFLRDGITYLKKVRDLVALVYSPEKPDGVSQDDIVAAVRDLRDYGRSISGNHAMWGDYIMRTLERNKILKKELIDLEGM
ncbi:DUF4838 domain-containing protein [Candidatus Latescibacterota bacterium]